VFREHRSEHACDNISELRWCCAIRLLVVSFDTSYDSTMNPSAP
jgi:hypothetical protein